MGVMSTSKGTVTGLYYLGHNHTVQRIERDNERLQHADAAMRLSCSCGWLSRWHTDYASLNRSMDRHAETTARFWARLEHAI